MLQYLYVSLCFEEIQAMKTYTFGRCIALLDVDPKVFRRWVRDDLGLGEKDQISKADSRVRYLTREQLERLAELHEKILPADDQADGEEEHASLFSAGEYKLLLDRLAAVEQSSLLAQDTVSTFTGDLTYFESRLSHLRDLFEAPDSGIQARMNSIEHHLAEIEERLKEPPPPPEQEREAAPDQQIAEIEAQYQQRIAELEAQLALYKQPKTTSATKKKPTRRGKKTTIKTLPRTLVARNAFATLHNVNEKLVSKASIDGKIATVGGKWLSHDHVVVTRALNEQGKHDFYQVFHQRTDFKQCEHCPHDLP